MRIVYTRFGEDKDFGNDVMQESVHRSRNGFNGGSFTNDTENVSTTRTTG